MHERSKSGFQKRLGLTIKTASQKLGKKIFVTLSLGGGENAKTLFTLVCVCVCVILAKMIPNLGSKSLV